MNLRFPFVQIPKRVIYVDDDGKLLDALRMTMQPDMAREFITSPDAALQALSQEKIYWNSIEKMLARVQEKRLDGFAEANQYVGSYFRDWRRFHLTGVLIVDYNMPGLNGLELLKRINDCPARRVLLTGVADAEVAVRAFNSGLIQKFIPKNTPDLYGEIRRSSNDMHTNVCEHIGHLVRGTLRNDQIELLHDQRVIEGLLAKVNELMWTEWVVVGEPFGVLGMAHEGPLQWLQLETYDGLRSLSESMGELGYSAQDVRATANGHAIPVSEIRHQLGLPDDLVAIDADEICREPGVCAAVLDLGVQVLTAKDYGLDDIRTPEELMRALLRDVMMAARRAEQDDAGQPALEHAAAHLVSASALSKYHALALETVRMAAALPQAVEARIEAAIATERAKAGRR